MRPPPPQPQGEPPAISLEGTLSQAKRALERAYLERVLNRANGNLTEAARLSGLAYSSFRAKMRLYDVRMVAYVS